MAKGLLGFGLAAALVGAVILVLLHGPGVPVILFGLILGAVGGAMVVGQRRNAPDRNHKHRG
jgi:uncharacterized membrane protein YfcA